MAFFSRSPSSLSMLPSCCTSFTSISSSSGDILLSPSRWNILASSFFHRENSAFSGISSQIRHRRNGAAVMAQFSAQSLAMLLGEISPKISTTTVTTMVDSVAPASPKLLTNSAVARDAMAMFTMLLPIRMVDSSLS